MSDGEHQSHKPDVEAIACQRRDGRHEENHVHQLAVLGADGLECTEMLEILEG